MQEQLPTPISELLILNFYLGSITHLLGLIFIILVLRANGFKWTPFVIISALSIGLAILVSTLLWAVWPSGFDFMLGPIHLPALLSIALVCPLLLLIFGYEIRLFSKR